MTTQKKDAVLMTRVGEVLRDRLRAAAWSVGVPMSAWVRAALTAALEVEGQVALMDWLHNTTAASRNAARRRLRDQDRRVEDEKA